VRVELARSHVFDHTLTQRTDWRSRPVTALPAAQVCNPFPPTFDVHGRDDLECPSRPRSANGGRSQAERPRINLLRVRGNRQPSTCPSLILCGEQALSRIAAHSAHRLDELTAAELSASGSGHFGSDGLSMHVNKVSHVRTIDHASDFDPGPKAEMRAVSRTRGRTRNVCVRVSGTWRRGRRRHLPNRR
jgi:hypothetical protein